MRCFLIMCLAALLAACTLNPVVGAGAEPPPPATQTCPDGSVILASDDCPGPPPPPPPMANGHTANGHTTNGDAANGDDDGGPIVLTSGTRTSATGSVRAPAGRGAPGSNASAGPDFGTDAGIRPGKGTFAKPPPMKVGSWARLEFLVAPDARGIAAEAGGRAIAPGDDIFIASVMRVALLPDPNFEIDPQTPAEQNIGLDNRASWHWNVMPKTRAGTFTLVARVEVLDQGDSECSVHRSVGSRPSRS